MGYSAHMASGFMFLDFSGKRKLHLGIIVIAVRHNTDTDLYARTPIKIPYYRMDLRNRLDRNRLVCGRHGALPLF